MKKLLLLVPVSLLALSACGTKSYTYEVFYSVEGTGSVEVTTKDPKADQPFSQTEQLPIKRRAFLANGLGSAWVEVKRTDGGSLTCVLQVEKEPEVRQSGNPAKCEFTITEDTDN